MGIGRALWADVVDEAMGAIGCVESDAGVIVVAFELCSSGGIDNDADVAVDSGMWMNVTSGASTPLVRERRSSRRLNTGVGICGRTDGIATPKLEFQSVYLILVQWIFVQHSDVHLPLLKIVRLDQLNARGWMLLCLLCCQD